MVELTAMVVALRFFRVAGIVLQTFWGTDRLYALGTITSKLVASAELALVQVARQAARQF